MSSGNRSRNKVKGFHLSADACEMLEQLVIVLGGSESHHVNAAIREYFIKHKLQYREGFGEEYWGQCLESYGHTDRLKIRRKQPAV